MNMEIRELLLSNGLSTEQADTVLAAMKENKIYTTSQENIDIRYDKLKQKHDDLTEQISAANNTIDELKKSNGDNQSLQTALDKYKADYETLQKESDLKIRNMTIDTQIKSFMKEYKVKEKYDELLMSKIDKTALELDDKGSVTGLKDVFDGLKTEYADLFTAEPPKLGGNPPNQTGSSTNNTSATQEQIHNLFKS